MVRNNPETGEVFSIKNIGSGQVRILKNKKQDRHGESSAGPVKIHAQIL